MSVDQPFADGFDEAGEKQLAATCPECAGQVTSDGGEKACQECGLIADEYYLAHDLEPWSFEDGPDKQRTGDTLTPARHDRGLSTKIGKYTDGNNNSLSETKRRQLRRLRREHNRAQFQSKAERNLAHACGEIARLVSALDLSYDLRFASSIFRKAQDADLLVGRSIETIATGCVVAACRCRGQSCSVADVASVARCSRDKVLNGYQTINVKLDLKTSIIRPQERLPELASSVSIADEVRRRAFELAGLAEDEGLANGRRPSGVAAGAIYVACQSFDEDVTQRELGEAADVSPVTIRARMNEFQAIVG